MRSILPAVLFLVSCAHAPGGPWNPHKNAATKAAHQQVLSELESQQRTPASVTADLGANLADLNRLRPGKFSVFVFPKVSTIHHKTAEPVETYLGAPRAFEVSVIAENPCQQFIQRGLFASLTPRDVYPASLAENRSRRCAILEVTDLQLKNKARGALKPGDALMQRLFLDDAYQVYAVDSVLYETPRSNRTVRVLNDEKLAANSGLSLFPIDLPSRRAKVSTGVPADGFAASLDGVAVHQIRARHLRSFATPRCRGAVTTDRDVLGSQVRIGWCQGMPWPAFSETARFVSVTQPLSLGGQR